MYLNGYGHYMRYYYRGYMVEVTMIHISEPRMIHNRYFCNVTMAEARAFDIAIEDLLPLLKALHVELPVRYQHMLLNNLINL